MDTIKKAEEDDHLIIPSTIEKECLNYTKKKKAKISEKTMRVRLSELDAEHPYVQVPTIREMKGEYWIRDEDDYKILYSANKTRADLLVTGDDDYYDNVKGLKNTQIIRPRQYREEFRPRYSLSKIFRRMKR